MTIKMTIEELEAVYNKADPWNYKTHPADAFRKEKILKMLNHFGPYEKALDIACGEGWITQDIPAKEIFGYEVSRQAILRWPKHIKHFGDCQLEERFDLVLITGALYENYQYEKLIEIANHVATKYIVTCNIADREYKEAIDNIKGDLIYFKHFPYHRSETEQFTQRLRVYRK